MQIDCNVEMIVEQLQASRKKNQKINRRVILNFSNLEKSRETTHT